MTITYLDASAAMKLLVDQAESTALLDALLADPARRLVSSWLLHAELHCAAGRHPDAVDRTAVQAVLDTVDLIDVARGDLMTAGTHAPLRSNDALHLAVALRLGVDELACYDQELAAAARSAGLRVLSPG